MQLQYLSKKSKITMRCVKMEKKKLTKAQLEKKEKERKARESAYQVKLIRENYKRFEIKIRLDDEADMITHLLATGNVQAYIKGLIRADMETKDGKNEN